MKKICFTGIYLIIINLSISFSMNTGDNPNARINLNAKNTPVIKTKPTGFFVGADFGASFGTFTVIRLSPLIGYKVSQYISTGAKFVYIHSWEQINQGTTNATTLQSNSVGGNLFIQYNPVVNFYLKTEFEYDNFKNYATTQNTSSKQGVPFLFLGAGYSTPVSRTAIFNAGLKVDVLNNQHSPFPDYNPFFSAGITVGI